jgi:hypothetical protein
MGELIQLGRINLAGGKSLGELISNLAWENKFSFGRTNLAWGKSWPSMRLLGKVFRGAT